MDYFINLNLANKSKLTVNKMITIARKYSILSESQKETKKYLLRHRNKLHHLIKSLNQNFPFSQQAITGMENNTQNIILNLIDPLNGMENNYKMKANQILSNTLIMNNLKKIKC